MDHFIRRLNRRMNKQVQGVSQRAMRVLLNHTYPGNVRELQNILEHAMILCKGLEIQVSHLPSYLLKAHRLYNMEVPSDGRDILREKEREAILEVMRAHSWRITEAARALGIHRSTLWRKMKRLGLERDR